MEKIKLLFIYSFLFYDATTADICYPNKEYCTGNDCNRLTECVNGICGIDGSCTCNSCYIGENCSIYFDEYTPVILPAPAFHIRANTIGEIGKINVFDGDIDNNCLDVPCKCADYRFDLEAGNTLISIDPTTGVLSSFEELHSNRTYYLDVLLLDPMTYDIVDRTEISIVTDESPESPPNDDNSIINEIDNELDVLVRSKRKTPAQDPGETKLDLEVIRDTIVESLRPGETLTFRVKIILPTGLNNAIKVKITGKDIDTGLSTVTIHDVKVEDLPGNTLLKDSTGNPLVATNFKPTYQQTTDSPYFSIYAEINLGDIQNDATYEANTIDTTDSEIYIVYSATMIINEAYAAPFIKILAGVEFDSSNYIWVSEGEVSYTIAGEPAVIYPTKMTFQGPDAVPSFSGGLFEANGNIILPTGKLMFEAFIGGGEHDLFSIESIGLVRKGKYINNNPGYTEPPSYTKSVTGKTNVLAAMNFEVIATFLNVDDLAALLEDPNYEYSFLITVFPYNAKVDDTLSIYVILMLGETQLWTSNLDFTVSEELVPSTGSISSMTFTPMGSNPPLVKEFGSALYKLELTMTDNTGAAIDCSVTPSNQADAVVSGISYINEDFYPVSRFVPLEDGLKVIYLVGGGTIPTLLVNCSTVKFTSSTYNEPCKIGFYVSVNYPSSSPGEVSALCTDVNSVSITAQSDNSVTETNLAGTTLVYDDTNWYRGTVAALKLYVNLKDAFYSKVMYEVDEPLKYGHLCKIELKNVQSGAQSLLIYQDTLSGFLDSAEADLSNTSITLGPMGAPQVCSESKMTYTAEINAYFMFPLTHSGVYNEESKIAGGFELSNGTSLLAGSTTFTTKDLPAPTYDVNLPAVYFDQASLNNYPFETGKPFMHKFNIKTNPGSVAGFKIIVTEGANAMICGIYILNMGSNYPCIDYLDYENKQDDPNQVIIIDQTRPAPFIEILAIRNTGSELPIYTEKISDENSIEFGIVGRQVNTANNAVQFSITVQSNAVSKISSNIALTAATPTGEGVGTLQWSVNSTITTYENHANPDYIELTVPLGYQKKVSISFSNVDSEGKIAPCSVSVISSGKNVPCVSQETSTLSTVTEVNTETLILNLGAVCYIFLDKTTNDPAVTDTVRIKYTVKIGAGVSSAQLTVKLLENDAEYLSQTVTVNNGGTYTEVTELQPDGFALSSIEPSVTVEPGSEYELKVSATIPTYVQTPLKIGVYSNSTGGIAEVTMVDISISTVGTNIECLWSSPYDEQYYTKEFGQNFTDTETPLVHESQKNELIYELDVISNSGETHMAKTNAVGDDAIEVMAKVLVGDNDAILDQGEFYVYFVFKYGNNIIIVETVNLTMSRTNQVAPSIIAGISVQEELTVYETKSKIDFSVDVKHDMTSSTAELYDAIIRVCLPQHIVYVEEADAEFSSSGIDVGDVNSIQSNIPHTLNPSKGPCLDMNIDYLFFTDILSLNFSVTVNPYDTLPKGLEPLNGIAILRIVGKQSSKSNAYSYFGTPIYAQYKYSGTEAETDLEIENYQACQFSASSALNAESMPEKVASTDASEGWIPGNFVPMGVKGQHLTVSFNAKTRLTKITFLPVTGKSSISEYTLKTSQDGIYFTDACSKITYVDNEMLPKECRSATRYVRIVIEKTSSSDDFALRMKMFGEYKETPSTDCPTVLKPTLTMDSLSVPNSHYLYDPNAGILYFCYYIFKDDSFDTPKCYSTSDGDTYNPAPNYVKKIAGYDASTQQVFAASSDDSVHFVSTDGIIWGMVDTNTIPTSYTSTPENIPMQSGDPVIISGSTWEVDSSGFKMGGELKIKHTL